MQDSEGSVLGWLDLQFGSLRTLELICTFQTQGETSGTQTFPCSRSFRRVPGAGWKLASFSLACFAAS